MYRKIHRVVPSALYSKSACVEQGELSIASDHRIRIFETKKKIVQRIFLPFGQCSESHDPVF